MSIQYEDGYAAGVQAAREAVEACKTYKRALPWYYTFSPHNGLDQHGGQRVAMVVKECALAAIDALKEKP